MKLVHVSSGISKLGPSIPSINLPPGLTCDPTAGCFEKCYARKGRFAFSHNKELLRNNLDVWLDNPGLYEQSVLAAASLSRYFRFHSSGDIPDPEYLEMMDRVACRCPNTSILCFTKKFELIDNRIDERGPFHDNLHIVLSAWGDDFVPENRHNLPVAYIRFKHLPNNKIPQDAYPCYGYCGECIQTGHSCWDLKPGESVCFNEH